MNNILLPDVEKQIKIYLETKHPHDSNGFIIRLSNKINLTYEMRKSYIVRFPIINQNMIEQIIDKWTDYALNNIIDNYDLNQEMTILSIDSLKFSYIQSEITIMFSGETISPEIIIRRLSIDIIEQLNKHLIEVYMDKYYPEIDIGDSEKIEEFNEIFDNIELDHIYGLYPQVEIYIPLTLSNSSNEDIVFYINGTINTKSQMIDIINDIRICLDSNNLEENIIYDKEDIVYKYGINKELQIFSIISDPQI